MSDVNIHMMDCTTTSSNDSVSEVSLLKNRIKDLEEQLGGVAMFRKDLQFQQYIDSPPVQNKEVLYQRACANDGVTIDSFFDTWLKHVDINCKEWDVENNTAMLDYAKFAYKPGIVAGAGPHLKTNARLLKDRGDMALVSCLHNFGYLEDVGAHPDYYLNLDAGDITIPEMSEGGKNGNADYYWDLTKNRTLVTSITANPELHRKWKGRILWYSAVAADPRYVERLKKLTSMNLVYSVGGNTLGACLYHAKSILGCCPIAFVGADFSFGYDKQFHSWNSQYKFSGVVPTTDIFGNRVYTYPSYFNFKCWFDYIACGGAGNQPGLYYNCTEGGILGAYPEGNIRQIQQLPLEHFLWTYNVHKKMGEMQTAGTYQYLF